MLRLVVLAALLAAVAGCQPRGSERALARFGGAETPTVESERAAASAPARSRQQPDAQGSDAQGPDAQGHPPAASPPSPRQARRPGPEAVPPPDLAPAQLIGLSRAGLAARLGRPTAIRREPPAEIWQYRAGPCVLDLFLYPEPDGRRVVHLEARDRQAAPVAATACLGQLRRRALAG